jgi:hypothetical protein
MANRMLSLNHVACFNVWKEHTRYTALCRHHYLRKYFVFAFDSGVTSFGLKQFQILCYMSICYEGYCQINIYGVPVARFANFVTATNLQRPSIRKYSN